MKRRTPILAMVVAAILAMTLIGPAHADVPSTPTVSDLDASVPGHLSGTITSPGAPYLTLRFEPGVTDVPSTTVTLTGDSGSFDVETWGYEGESPIWLQACTDANHHNCGEPTLAPETFVAIDVAPTSVTWSSDLTVGQYQPVTATVVDEGGGTLIAERPWATSQQRTTLGQSGATNLNAYDGSAQFQVRRCAGPYSHRCVTYPGLTSPTYTIRRNLGLSFDIPPTLPGDAATTINIDTAATGSYDIAWHVAKDGTDLPEPSGSATGTLGSNGQLATIQIPAGSLPEGTYAFEASLTVTDPDFGKYTVTWGTWPFYDSPQFRINLLPPIIESLTLSTAARHNGIPAIYPNIGAPDRPRSTWIYFDAIDWHSIEIRSAQGVVVKSWSQTPGFGFVTPSWSGTSQSGAQVPTGTYTIVVRDIDGQAATKTAKIYVSIQRRVQKTWTRTVTARASMVEAYVGRCSTLRKPSARGWAGSLGYYANTKCGRQTWRASAVSTMHGIYVPTADKYLSIKVQVYGGAAKARPKSYAGFRLWGRNGEWRSWNSLTPTLGLHLGGSVGATTAPNFVYPDRSFYWGMATASGGRYDVKTFKVTVSYYALV